MEEVLSADIRNGNDGGVEGGPISKVICSPEQVVFPQEDISQDDPTLHQPRHSGGRASQL